MKIDFGGIAKGYTSGRIADIYRECGVTSGLINLGGNVQVVGTKTDGSKWRVAVQSPEAEDDYLGILSTADRAVITSGGYERYFEQDGMKYHHIIDPSTGHPANNGLVSVTIVSADGTLQMVFQLLFSSWERTRRPNTGVHTAMNLTPFWRMRTAFCM